MAEYYKEERDALRFNIEKIKTQEQKFIADYEFSSSNYFNVHLQRDIQLMHQTTVNNSKYKMAQLNEILNNPYEGRIDITSNDVTETCYIGHIPYYVGGCRIDVNPTTAKKIIYDWRSPKGNTFRRRLKNHSGDNVILNTSTTIKEGKLLAVFNQFDFRLNKEELKVPKIIEEPKKGEREISIEIVPDMEIKSESELIDHNKDRKSILSTLSIEQNDMIDLGDANMIIQGVPGSGKTVVGGYRLSQLVYNHIVGKNTDFRAYFITSNEALLRQNQPYFSNIDISSINFRVFDKLVLNAGSELVSKQKTPDKVSRTRKVFSILNDQSFKELIDELITNEDDLNTYMSTLKTRYYLSSDENQYLKYIIELYFTIKNMKNTKVDADIDYIERTIKLEDFDYRLLNKERENPSSSDVERLAVAIDKIYRSGKGKINITYKSSYGVTFTREDENYIDRINRIFDEGLPARFPISDYLELLSIYRKLYSIKLRRYKSVLGEKKITETQPIALNQDVKHILLDEAQDYSLFEILVLRNYYPNAYWTICGDINQSNGESDVLENWDDLQTEFECKLMKLNTCFRSSKHIVDLMNLYAVNENYGLAVSPDNYEGEGEVLVVHEKDLISARNANDLIKSFVPEDTCIVMIDTSKLRSLSLNPVLNKFEFREAKDVKGMEFKNVVILDSSILKNEISDKKFKYMLVSRALNNLIAIEDSNDILELKEETKMSPIF